MSLISKIIKIAIKLTPSALIIWVGNFVLKGIAQLTEFSFDLDTRKVHVQTRLYGEVDTIDVWLEDFAVVTDGESYEFMIKQAKSDRPWLTNILALIVGKAWKIPAIPQLAPYLGLVAELLHAEQVADVATESEESPLLPVIDEQAEK
jgi:hypothetical protein